MAEMFNFAMKGAKTFVKGTEQVETRMNIATIAALKANQNKIKTAVKANLRGAPRWSQKGKNRITGPNFQVQGTTGQNHYPRDGGPGRMTGVLYKGVGGVRKPKEFRGMFYGGVGVGAKPNNVKKRVLEAKYPYFRPAVEKTEPLISQTYEKGWSRAMNRMGGVI
jgi:hypothetical protein